MKSKADKGSDGSSQTDVSQHESGKASRLSSMKHRTADVSAGNNWPTLQVLRRNLMVMSKPLPLSTRQIFKMENSFRDLYARPMAITLQALEQSEALGQNLQMFSSSETELIKTLPLSARQIFKLENSSRDLDAGPMAVTVQGLERTEALESNAVRRAAKTEKQLPETRGRKSRRAESLPHAKATHARNDSAAQMQSHFESGHSFAEPASNQTRMDGRNAAEPLPGGDFLAPGFMRQWIEEILAAGTAANNSAGENAKGVLDRKKSSSPDSRLMDSSGRRHTRSRNLPGHEKAALRPVHQRQAAGATFDKNARLERVDASAPPDSPQVAREMLAHTVEISQARQHKSHPGISTAAAVATAGTVFEGIALLQQIVQADAAVARLNPKRRETAAGVSNQAASTADISSLTKNPAWQQQWEKNLRSAGSPVRGDSTGLIASPPDTMTGDSPGAGNHDESDRIATLLNEALVEQAIRHGVDLS